MHKSTVICDQCGGEQALEPFNGNSNYRMPKGWATVGAHITVAGVSSSERERIKELIRKRLMPVFHLCPTCTEDKEKKEKLRLAEEAEARKIQEITEPPRRVFR